jgi:hypothetical protein
MEDSAGKTTSCRIPSSAENDSMNRQLNFNSIESDRKREATRLAPHAPPFDIDTPPEVVTDHENDVEEQPAIHTVQAEIELQPHAVGDALIHLLTALHQCIMNMRRGW